MATTGQQLELLTVLMEPVLDALGGFSEDGEISSDDILDLFALAMAAVIEHDDDLQTPHDMQLGALSAAQRIHDHVRALRATHGVEGVSTFAQLIRGGREYAASGMPN